MGLPEIVDLARNFAVMVRVQGPDPKGVKMRKHAFHQWDSGKTTLQASGMLLLGTLYDAELAKGFSGCNNGSLMLVVTMASVLEPFLSLQHRDSLSQGRPELISGAQIDIMVEDRMRAEKIMDKGAPSWLPAQLLTLVNVPAFMNAFHSLTEASSGSLEHEWEVGWSLASRGNSSHSSLDIYQTQIEHENRSFTENQRHLEVEKSSNLSLMGTSSARIAILGFPIVSKDLPNITIAPSNKRGDLLLAVGSPFGVISPLHFFNSVAVGSVANCFPPDSSNKLALLMADIRCLPGMEGGPVFGEHGHLIGILSRPLKHKASGAEIQLVIPWEAIATACNGLLQKEPQNAEKGNHSIKESLNAVGKAFISNSHCSDGPFSDIHEHHNLFSVSPSRLEKAMASICLITIHDGVWASGVLLNKQGLILTNAHLLEPWRYGKTNVNGGRHRVRSQLSISSEDFVSDGQNADDEHISQNLIRQTLKISESSMGDELSMFCKGHRNIKVRLVRMDSWIWYDAKPVYVCKGPLDIALLQLENVHDQLSPVSMDFASPCLGSKAYVIGHGLLGPECGVLPSVCSGVVAKVVKAKMLPSYKRFFDLDTHLPAMLETTAAVHPGGSGGAVVNSDGHMIGLVTSNARHGGGTIIPHLNFSIPSAALAPIFKFSEDMQDVSLLRDLDEQSEQLSFIWALMPQLSPKPGPALPNLPRSPLGDNEKGVKGSRFAKFISERQELFRRPTQCGELKKLSNDNIPSKL